MTDSGASTGTVDTELDYSTAVDELDAILVELEDDTLNVDILAARVHRASELITFCRERITAAKTEVEHIVASMDASEDTE